MSLLPNTLPKNTCENIPDWLPVMYFPNFIPEPEKAFKALSEELAWVKRGDTPRHEYYCNDVPLPYVYGVGRGERLYEVQPYHDVILEIRKQIIAVTQSNFEVCFLNRYLDQSDHLGWHADDSPEMDDARPIAIVSLGVEREIWFRQFQQEICGLCLEEVPNHKTPDCQGPDLVKRKTVKIYSEVQKLKLGNGSLCLMSPGMQNSWLHRIPKSSHICGERISLTYRGYVNPNTGKPEPSERAKSAQQAMHEAVKAAVAEHRAAGRIK